METQFEEKNFDVILTTDDLNKLKEFDVICKGYGYIEHYWFNDAKVSLEDDKKSTKVKFICIKAYGDTGQILGYKLEIGIR